mgnify:CR=1 FL=1
MRSRIRERYVDDTREHVDAAVANPLGVSVFGHSVRSKAMRHGSEWASRPAELVLLNLLNFAEPVKFVLGSSKG